MFSHARLRTRKTHKHDLLFAARDVQLHLLLFITRKYEIICVKRRPIVRRYIH